MQGTLSSRRPRVLGLVAPVLATLALAPNAGAEIGADGVGDPIFPAAGNGGYDVGHYDLDLQYTPKSERLDAVATVTATAAAELERFNLDYRGPRVRSVTVNGEPAAWSQEGTWELVVTPATPIPAGGELDVRVAYAGIPEAAVEPWPIGWLPTHDGAWVANASIGASTWFPCSDHPSDKATLSVDISVPRRTEAISNGVLVFRRRQGDRVTYSWREREPLATYLMTVTSGDFEIDRGRVAGIPYLAAFDTRYQRRIKHDLRTFRISDRQIDGFRHRQGQILRAFARWFGPYPFSTTGGIVDDPEDDRVFYALETQTRPIYHHAVPAIETQAHELAHQWWGDSVTPSSWQDIWLNEGFAEWSAWTYIDESGGRPLQRSIREALRSFAISELWDPPGSWAAPTATPPDAEHLFDYNAVYARGALTLAALADRVGERSLRRILRAWAEAHRYGNATTADFIALAERVSGRKLAAFFDAWLYQPERPPERFFPDSWPNPSPDSPLG